MNRSVMAARAAQRPAKPANMAHFPAEPIQSMAQQPRSRRAVRLTATQRDSKGRLSAWNRSPYAPRMGWR